MDNLTHTLAGAVLGEAGLKDRTALAMPTLLIGANLPDVDVIVLLFGDGLGLGFRRGWTHGILALLVLPLVLTAIMLAWNRWVRGRGGRVPARPVHARQLLALSFIAVCSHPLLDWLNTYGMRWLMPFDGTWFYGDALFIVDPWVLLILLVGVVAARRGRRVTPGLAALGITAAYITGMVASATAGRHIVARALPERGIHPEEVMVGPQPVNANQRQVVIREGDDYYVGTLRWLPRPRLEIAAFIPSNRAHPAAEAAFGYAEAESFLRWARFPYVVVVDLGDRYAVRMDDLRYSDGTSPSFAAVRVEVPRGSRTLPPATIAGAETRVRPAP